jgi:hypothetical protein
MNYNPDDADNFPEEVRNPNLGLRPGDPAWDTRWDEQEEELPSDQQVLDAILQAPTTSTQTKAEILANLFSK